MSVAKLLWAEQGKVCKKASLLPLVLFVLNDHILLLRMEIWRINYDVDLTPFPFVGARWPRMFGLLEILALLKWFFPHFELDAAFGVTTSKLPDPEHIIRTNREAGLVCGFREKARVSLYV